MGAVQPEILYPVGSFALGRYQDLTLPFLLECWTPSYLTSSTPASGIRPLLPGLTESNYKVSHTTARLISTMSITFWRPSYPWSDLGAKGSVRSLAIPLSLVPYTAHYFNGYNMVCLLFDDLHVICLIGSSHNRVPRHDVHGCHRLTVVDEVSNSKS